MKFLLALLLFLIVSGAIYLNRSYAYFYDYQGDHFIANPVYDYPYSPAKKMGRSSKKVVVLGDSLMAGTGSSKAENSLAFLIADGMSEKSNVSMLNFAQPGVGIRHVLKTQLPKALNEKPDIILIMIGTNDVHSKLPDEEFKELLLELLTNIKSQTSARIIIVNIPYIGSGSILLPPWDTVLDLQIKKFNNIISETATEKGVSVIDLYAEFRNKFKDPSDLYSDDHFHPSDKGYRLWADYINANLNL